MDYNRFYTELHHEKDKRLDEIRILNNLLQLNFESIAVEKDNYRNSLKRANICLTYAHIEGFVKFSFTHYITAINNLKLECKDVTHVLKAAVYLNDFAKMANPDRKSKIFKKIFPFDGHLHKIFRQEEFFEAIESCMLNKVEIPDKYINTESNVGKEVLEKLLYQIGLPHQILNGTTNTLTKLLNKRNDIAHGVDMKYIQDSEYKDYVQCARDVIVEIACAISNAYKEEAYLLPLKH